MIKLSFMVFVILWINFKVLKFVFIFLLAVLSVLCALFLHFQPWIFPTFAAFRVRAGRYFHIAVDQHTGDPASKFIRSVFYELSSLFCLWYDVPNLLYRSCGSWNTEKRFGQGHEALEICLFLCWKCIYLLKGNLHTFNIIRNYNEIANVMKHIQQIG